MKVQHLQACILVLFLGMVALVSRVNAQTAEVTGQTNEKEGAAYAAKRQQAMQLFDQGKHLEALPLLEELAQKSPDDTDVVVALAASLVGQASTLTDRAAAAKERLRAKDLLEKSGSTGPLAKNLLQVLRTMPDGSEVQFSQNPAVEQAMRAGEAAFSRGDFDEAITNYSKALELEPKNYEATLFIGNSFHRKNDFAKAQEWYEKAIGLDPNTETAYRYDAHMLMRKGDLAKARTMLIHAAVAEPYNRIVWHDLKIWTAFNSSGFNLSYAGVLPDSMAPKKNDSGFEISLFPKRAQDLSDAWEAYHLVRTDWKERGKFKQHFPDETGYRHSLAEETEALIAEVRALQQLRGDIGTAELVTEDQSLMLLLKLYDAGLLEPYVLFRLGDDGIAKDYATYREKNRDKLEEYLEKFVIPAAPRKTNSDSAKSEEAFQ
jgi:Flp pilus assembly protein TadD